MAHGTGAWPKTFDEVLARAYGASLHHFAQAILKPQSAFMNYLMKGDRDRAMVASDRHGCPCAGQR